MTRDDSRFDLISMGRVGVDLYPLEIGVGLAEVASFGKFLGGSATNVAVATARYGRSSAVVTAVGADPFGEFVRREIARLGVDARFVSEIPGLNTPIVFCEIFPPDRFPLYFYREPVAPDLMIEPEGLDLAAIEAARVFWITTTGLSRNPSRAAHRAALAERSHGGDQWTVLDLDYRKSFWQSPEDARSAVADALPHVDVAIGNLEECEVAVGAANADRAARALLDRGVRLAIVKQGPHGVLGMTRDKQVSVPPMQVDVVNGLGAGDAFGGAVVHGLLAGWDLETILRFANAAGAIVAGRLECATAMPSADEVERALEVSHA